MISIIVPVYNVETYLENCLDSLLGQTYKDIEVICVNDGSTDSSLAILREYESRDSRVKVIDKCNEGVSVARNTAMKQAVGEWTMFVDSDDWIESDTCQKALDAAVENKADMVMWAYVREFESQSLPKIFHKEQTIWQNDDIEKIHRRFVGPVGKELVSPDTMDAWGTIWGKLYKTSLLSQPPSIWFTDIRHVGSAEDVLFNIDYARRMQVAVYLPLPLYHYRKIITSLTYKHNASLSEKWENLYEEIENRVNSLPSEFMDAYHNRISLGIIGLGLNEVFAKVSPLQKYKAIEKLLTRPRYREAVKHLSTDYMPLQWKTLFFSAKHNIAILVYILLEVISFLIRK